MRYLKPLLVLPVVAACALSAAPAHAQAPSSATVTSGDVALRFVGGDAANNVRFTLSGNSFIVDDVVPVKAGIGCEPVAGDPTKAKCVAPKAGSKFKEFTVGTGNGNDKVVNATSTTTTVGAPMRANGGPGNDELIGDVKVNDVLLGSSNDDVLRAIGGQDELDGGSGDDKVLGGSGGDKLAGGTGNDLLDGGAGDDQLDGGSGRDIIDGGPAGISVGERHDRVLYSDRTGSVTINLTRTDASQGTQANPGLGVPAEGDTILDVEDVSSGRGADFITGNQFANTIDGGAGDDIINGLQGRDILSGNDGNDFLVPSPLPNVQFPFGSVPDGEADVLECGKVGVNDGDAGDKAFRVVIDGDTVNDCADVGDV